MVSLRLRELSRYAIGCIAPAIYYTNTWYAKYLPISSTHSFDNTGKSYDVSRIISNGTNFDEAKYKAYSPLFLSTTFALSYGLSFASITGENTGVFSILLGFADTPFSNAHPHVLVLPQANLDASSPLHF